MQLVVLVFCVNGRGRLNGQPWPGGRGARGLDLGRVSEPSAKFGTFTYLTAVYRGWAALGRRFSLMQSMQRN